MAGFLLLLLILAGTFVDAWLVQFVCWTFENAGYVDHVPNYGQAWWIGAAFLVIGVLGTFVKGFTEELIG